MNMKRRLARARIVDAASRPWQTRRMIRNDSLVGGMSCWCNTLLSARNGCACELRGLGVASGAAAAIAVDGTTIKRTFTVGGSAASCAAMASMARGGCESPSRGKATAGSDPRRRALGGLLESATGWACVRATRTSGAPSDEALSDERVGQRGWGIANDEASDDEESNSIELV